MSDHIATAHALRSAMHAWLKQHPDASMAQIVAAFADTPEATVRKSMQRLAHYGFAKMDGNGRATRYRALGDAIYSVAEMCARMRTGHGNLLHDYNRDRLALAWKARRDIHALVKARPMLRMGQIIAAFHQLPDNTVRKHVGALVKKGNLAMHGTQSQARYSAATPEIYGVEEVREKLRDNGRAVGALPTAQHPAYNPGANPVDAVQTEQRGGLCQAKNGKYTNHPCRRRPIRNQQGQGSSGDWQGGQSLLASIF